MGRFQNFSNNTGNEQVPSGNDFLYSRHAKLAATDAKQEELTTYRAEFEKCTSRDALRKYIRKNIGNLNNPFIDVAADKLDDLDFAEAKKSIGNAVAYLENHPDGKYRNEVTIIKGKLEDDKQQREREDAEEDKKMEKMLTSLAE